MKSFLSISVLIAVLNLTQSQRITRFTACMQGKNLRFDCRFENKTDNQLRYEFTLTKDHEEIIASTRKLDTFSPRYHNRTTVNVTRNLVLLYLKQYSSIDKGTYGCRLEMDNDYTDKQKATVKVMKDYFERCAGVCLINSMPSLLLLLSLPLIQAFNAVSL